MKRTRKIVFLSVLLAAFAAAQAQPIKIVGSDILGEAIMKAAASSMKTSNLQVETSFRGTRTALEDLQKGAADFGIIGIPRGAKMPEDLICVPVCYQTALVIVNALNPLSEISTRQLSSIYGKSASPRFETWDKVSRATINLRAIHPYVTNFSDNLVIELFKYSAMEGDELGPWVNVPKLRDNAFSAIKTNNSAIAIVGKPDRTTAVKVLSVSAREDGEHAFKPTIENIQSGDYPMVLPFYVAFKKEKAPQLKQLVESFLSDETAAKIDDGDFYAVPQNFRKRSILELDMMK